LVVLIDGGCSIDGFAEDLLHEQVQVDALLGGVYRRVALCLAWGVGDASILFGFLHDMASAECKNVAKT
jgi:hypothetical protein